MGFVPATAWIPMVGVIRRIVPNERRGLVFGFLLGSGGYGAIVNGQIVPYLLNIYDWRTIWIAAGVVTLLFAAGSLWFLASIGAFDERQPQESGASFNIVNAIADLRKSSSLLLAVLIWAIMALGGAIMLPYQTFLTALARETLHVDRVLAGQMTLLHGCVGILAAPVVGWLADRVNIRICFGIVALNLLLACALLYTATSMAFVVFSVIFFGVAFYSFFSLPPAYVSKTQQPAVGIFIFAADNFFVGGGAFLGNVLGGGIYQVTQSMSSVFLGLMGLVLLLAFTCWFLPPDKEAHQE